MKLDKSAFVSQKVEVVVPYNGGELKLYVSELGYMQSLNLASIKTADTNIIAEMVALAVTDAEGNKFTTEEVLKLKKEIAKPLFDAVLKINGLSGDDEKN